VISYESIYRFIRSGAPKTIVGGTACEGKQTVLAVTLSDANNVKYLISFRVSGMPFILISLKHASRTKVAVRVAVRLTS
jgi:hypothetical protein